MTWWGSSPRMRGTRAVIVRGGWVTGLIPTYAGNTFHTVRVTARQWAHPHVCGEHLRMQVFQHKKLGSSPRMRGTPLSERPPNINVGLIPTYAGNTVSGWLLLRRGRAHPHVCGEHCYRYHPEFSNRGSSPRMRGTLRGPASLRCRGGAHPHVCGEHSLPDGVERTLVGSSPRMRGTPNVLQQGLPLTGLIPTYAGNTKKGKESWILARAHPHVCGEHPEGFKVECSLVGSSPRMRGTPGNCNSGRMGFGLIPTYAGNTTAAGCMFPVPGAHPHVCGEHCAGLPLSSPWEGSSPRMRGTR